MTQGSSRIVLHLEESGQEQKTGVVTVVSQDNAAPNDEELKTVFENYPRVLREGFSVGGPWYGSKMENGSRRQIKAFFNLASGALPDREDKEAAAKALEKKYAELKKKNKRGPVAPTDGLLR